MKSPSNQERRRPWSSPGAFERRVSRHPGAAAPLGLWRGGARRGCRGGTWNRAGIGEFIRKNKAQIWRDREEGLHGFDISPISMFRAINLIHSYSRSPTCQGGPLGGEEADAISLSVAFDLLEATVGHWDSYETL